MAGVGLGGFFNGDPNPNPFTDVLPPSGALLGSNGEIIVQDSSVDSEGFTDDEGWDPPTGNGLGGPQFPEPINTGFPVGKITNEVRRVGRSKLDTLKEVEEQIRSLLFERRRLLNELRAERDEIEKRLSVADIVTDSLDEMFPDILEHEIESGVIDER